MLEPFSYIYRSLKSKPLPLSHSFPETPSTLLVTPPTAISLSYLIDSDGINEKGKQKLLTREQLSKELISFL